MITIPQARALLQEFREWFVATYPSRWNFYTVMVTEWLMTTGRFQSHDLTGALINVWSVQKWVRATGANRGIAFTTELGRA